MRYLVEVAVGHSSYDDAIAVDGRAHPFRDLTDEPAPAIVGSRPVMVIELEDGETYVSEETKPPYRVPLMTEVAEIEPNGLSIVSTFSGAGGSCLGFRMAGYRVLWANEFIPAARETYAANNPSTILDDRDIRTVTAEEILAAIGLKRGELDVLEGSPPCASFSTAGKRSKDWGKVKKYSDGEQRTDDLFFEYVRLLDGLQPRAFVAENVSGLIKGVAKGYFVEILRALRAVGYRVEARLLDAQWLGVPQARQRIIFVGTRNDLDIAPVFPTPLKYRYSVRDAISYIDLQLHNGGVYGKPGSFRPADQPSATVGVSPSFGNGKYPMSVVIDDPAALRVVGGAGASFDAKGKEIDIDGPLPSVLAGSPTGGRGSDQFAVIHDTSGNRSLGDVTDQPVPTITVGGLQSNACHYRVYDDSGDDPTDPETGQNLSIKRFAIGPEWEKLREGESSDKFFNLVRIDRDKPSPTITGLGALSVGAAAVTHPLQPRKFTIAELRRLCAFPDDFVLTGSYAQQWERLGRSVPPLMMRAVAERLAQELLK